LAYSALARGGTAPAALSAANEVAVEAFVNGEIAFGAIPECIAEATDAVQQYELTLDAVREADRSARSSARAAVAERRVKIRGI
jgi:1-deoxy-D-xylulose-5-phosphate reductoisomerase